MLVVYWDVEQTSEVKFIKTNTYLNLIKNEVSAEDQGKESN